MRSDQPEAKDLPAEVIAQAVKTYQAEVAWLEVELHRPRRVAPHVDQLRAALEQRAAAWNADLRAEPKVARLLLRRLVGPLTLWDEAEAGVRWDAPVNDSLLEGLFQDVASPSGIAELCTVEISGKVAA